MKPLLNITVQLLVFIFPLIGSADIGVPDLTDSQCRELKKNFSIERTDLYDRKEIQIKNQKENYKLSMLGGGWGGLLPSIDYDEVNFSNKFIPSVKFKKNNIEGVIFKKEYNILKLTQGGLSARQRHFLEKENIFYALVKALGVIKERDYCNIKNVHSILGFLISSSLMPHGKNNISDVFYNKDLEFLIVSSPERLEIIFQNDSHSFLHITFFGPDLEIKKIRDAYLLSTKEDVFSGKYIIPKN